MEKLERNDLYHLFCAVRDVMSSHADELGKMDAMMGDGDLGLTMTKGFRALPELILACDSSDIGQTLIQAGMKMAGIVPSTMGTLMASGLMGGGKKIVGNPVLGPQQFADYLSGFAEGIAKRGKCKPGERTVFDAIGPAAHAAQSLLEEHPKVSLPEVSRQALQAAQKGVEATKDMLPRYGKAAVFADRAIGTIDQGAYAGYLTLLGYDQYISNPQKN